MKRFALTLALLLLAGSAFGQGILGGGILGGARIANPNFPTFLQGLQAWYAADRGTYQDAACQFTAADKSWLTIADASQTGLDPGTDDFLICGWCYVDSLATTRFLFDKRTVAAANQGYDLYITANGAVSALIVDASSISVTSAAGVVTTGKWYFFAYHADRSDKLNAYIGDSTTSPVSVANVDISTKAASNINGDGPLVVGDHFAHSNPYDGRLDSLMVFKAADLSAVASDIITWAYNSGSGRLCSEITAAQKTAWGAVSGWELGENSGIRYDSWGTNHLSQAFAELVTNGTFTDNSTGWTEGAGWAYGTNNEVATAADANLTQTTVVPTVGKLYSTSFALTATTGTLRFTLGGVNGTTRSTTATHTEQFRAITADTLVIDPVATFTGVLDTVSVMAAEILPAPGIVRGRSQDSNFATQLNGTSQYYTYTGTAFDPGTGDVTLFGSFYLDSLPTAAGFAGYVLFSAGTIGAGNDYFYISVDPLARMVVAFNDSGGAFSAASTSTVTVGSWNTFVVKIDRDGNCVVKLNNTSNNLGSIAGQADSTDPGQLFVGRYAAAASGYFAGRLDNLGFANRLTTDLEDTFLYNNGDWRQWSELGVAGTDGAALTSSVVKGFWEYDVKTALGTDSSGNGNHLTPAGTPTQGWGVNYLAGVCSYWQDLSGNGNHGLSSALATRMSYCTNVLNGKPVLCGDGVDDYMTTTLAGLPAATIFFVGNIAAASDVAYGVQDGADANRSYIGSSAADKFAGGVAANADDAITSNDDPGTAFFGSLQYSGDTETVTLYRNGTSEYSDAQSGAVSTALTYTIGARRTAAAVFDSYLDGQIAEIIVYNRSLPDTERKFIERALSYKWGIAP